MEEKIYFKPEDYGKKKGKKEKPEKKNRKGLKLAIFLIFIAIIVIVILWLLRGKTTTTGHYPENLRNESLECIAKDLVYEKTNQVHPISTEMRIVAIFYGESEMNSLNLKYSMRFQSDTDSAAAEAIAHVQFAENLSYSGLSYEEFNNKFTRLDNELVLTLYNSGGKMKQEPMYGYFLIEKNSDRDYYPNSLSEIRKNYESQGFTCKSSLDNK